MAVLSQDPYLQQAEWRRGRGKKGRRRVWRRERRGVGKEGEKERERRKKHMTEQGARAEMKSRSERRGGEIFYRTH